MHRGWSGERGVSLVEAAVVLGVMAALGAVMAPAVGGFIDQARQSRARQDIKAISEAIQSFITDTGEHQFLQNASNGATDAEPPTRLDTNRVNLLVSDGDVPALGSSVSGDTYWTQVVGGGTVDTMSNHLIDNTPAGSSSNRYRNPSDITRLLTAGGQNIDFSRTSSSGFNAPHSWRGPYLRGPIGPDPWGNRYAANVVFLDPLVTAAISGLTSSGNPAAASYPRLDVFVITAGPDEEIDTRAAQDGAVPGDDDLIELVSGNAK